MQKNDDGTYNFDGGHFGAERVEPGYVMVLPDGVEVAQGDPLQEEWLELEIALENFLSPTPAMALADAIGLVMRGAVAVGDISDDEILRIAPTLQDRHWRAGIDVAVGDVYSHQSGLWRCVQGHTTMAGWEPPAVPALWRRVEPTSEGPRVWMIGMDYAVGDVAFYPDLDGIAYRCVLAHTAQFGWEPPNATTLWNLNEPTGEDAI